MAVLTLGGGRGGGPLVKANIAAVATPATRNNLTITTNIFSSRDLVISLVSSLETIGALAYDSSLSGTLNIPLLYTSWRSSIPVPLSTFLAGGSK